MKKIKKVFNEVFIFPAHIIKYPFKGYEEFKYDNTGKFYVAIVLLVLASILNVVKFNALGFIINNNDPIEFNSIKLILEIVLPVVLFSIGNWTITTLFDGKGKLKEIFMMICYSLYPLVIIGIPNIILSNIFTTDEMAFYSLFQSISYVLMVYMIFFGMITIHEYSLFKTIITTLFSFVSIAIMLFVFLLFGVVFQQVYGYFYMVIKEILLRYF